MKRIIFLITIIVSLTCHQAHSFFVFGQRHWRIEDCISCKCHELQNPDQQDQCFQVKQFLLQLRKNELEKRNFAKEKRITSWITGPLGCLAGAIIAPLYKHQKVNEGWFACFKPTTYLSPQEYAAWAMLGAIVGGTAFTVTFLRPIDRAEQELTEDIPRHQEFYTNCQATPGLIDKMPKEALEKGEYVPKLTDEQRAKYIQLIAQQDWWQATARPSNR